VKRVLRIGSAVALGILVSVTARAQGTEWEATLYMLGASMSGETGVGAATAEVSLGFDEILENLEFGAMGRVRAARGPWAAGLDVIYMGLGASSDQPPADVDVDQTAIEASGGYRLGDHLEAIAGVRYVDLAADLRFHGPLGLQRAPDQDWWDPLVGVNLRAPLGRTWSLRGRADIGGFGVGSELTWQLEALADWKVSERVSLQLGYRYIDMDYEDDDSGFVYDMVNQGPQAGVTFHF
jgi:opacity protein-like surface antigen